MKIKRILLINILFLVQPTYLFILRINEILNKGRPENAAPNSKEG